MFLCAQARPRWDNNANQMWDGKIGIWPIGEYVPAARTSVKLSSRYASVEESKGEQEQVQGTTFGGGDTSNQGQMAKAIME